MLVLSGFVLTFGCGGLELGVQLAGKYDSPLQKRGELLPEQLAFDKYKKVRLFIATATRTPSLAGKLL